MSKKIITSFLICFALSSCSNALPSETTTISFDSYISEINSEVESSPSNNITSEDYSTSVYNPDEEVHFREIKNMICLKSLSNGDDCNLFAKETAINNYNTEGTDDIGYYYQINDNLANIAIVGNKYDYSYYYKGLGNIWEPIEWRWQTDYYEIIDEPTNGKFDLKEELNLEEGKSFIIYRDITFETDNDNKLLREKMFFEIKYYDYGSNLKMNIQSYLDEKGKNNNCFHGIVVSDSDILTNPKFVYSYSENYYSGKYNGGYFKSY